MAGEIPLQRRTTLVNKPWQAFAAVWRAIRNISGKLAGRRLSCALQPAGRKLDILGERAVDVAYFHDTSAILLGSCLREIAARLLPDISVSLTPPVIRLYCTVSHFRIVKRHNSLLSDVLLFVFRASAPLRSDIDCLSSVLQLAKQAAELVE
jgi:hypothetical protein